MNRSEPQIDPSDLLKQETELVEAGLELQTEGLKLLLAEMQALATLIQHSEHPGPDPATDAEIEAGFDNMPI